METDYTKAPVDPSGDGWFGHYGMGHWWECLGYGDAGERSPLPPLCTDAHIQAGPGEFGFYPLIDRSGGGGAAGPQRPPYYMAVVLAEPDALSGIPEYVFDSHSHSHSHTHTQRERERERERKRER